MILVLDACTISNLLHVVQDDSLIKLLNKCFNEVYITKEVLKEVDDNKYLYLSFYGNSRDKIKQLLSDLKLYSYISDVDSKKHQCTNFVRDFASRKNTPIKEGDGEFHSTLLSLYLSRWGGKDFMDNNNNVLFATDDAKARNLYIKVFSTNQIGTIIDSIDILAVFYLKGHLTKNDFVCKIVGILGLYNIAFNALKNKITEIKEFEVESNIQLSLTALMEIILEYKLDKLADTLHDNKYKKMYRSYADLKDLVKDLIQVKIDKKIAYIKERYDEIVANLLWFAD